jgi:hypothetical protein
MMLSLVQMVAREGKLTASRVACLMTGDTTAILRLYQEMIGEAEPEDLRGVWPVRLGEVTEQLQLDWYVERGGSVSRRGEVVVHSTYPWAAATLDGWEDVLACPIEVKHCGGWEPLEAVIDRYQPQMQWQMECANATECVLSVIMGAAAPVVEIIHRDDDYIDELLIRAQTFMLCVKTRTPPVAVEPVAAPVRAEKTYDMQGNNAWGAEAAVWLSNRDAAKLAQSAEKAIKALVPADAIKCKGHGIVVSRNRAGSLALRELST